MIGEMGNWKWGKKERETKRQKGGNQQKRNAPQHSCPLISLDIETDRQIGVQEWLPKNKIK